MFIVSLPLSGPRRHFGGRYLLFCFTFHISLHLSDFQFRLFYPVHLPIPAHLDRNIFMQGIVQYQSFFEQVFIQCISR